MYNPAEETAADFPALCRRKDDNGEQYTYTAHEGLHNFDVLEAHTISVQHRNDAQEAVDAKIREWFGRTSELGAFDADAVLEAGKSAAP